MATPPSSPPSSTASNSASSDANTSAPDDTCVSTPITHRELPSRQPSPFNMDKTSTARSAHTPLQKLLEEPRWPLGVISGGTVIDMLEHLSQTASHSDYALTLWLERYYVKPFGRIDRLDGLIVTNELHLLTLHTAYERYIEVTGPRTRAQNLYVHGLEARYMPETSNFDNIPTKVPKKTEFKKWRGAEMYAKNGLEVEKKGVFVEVWVDEKGWERKIWRAPEYQGKSAKREIGNGGRNKAKDKGKGTGVRKDSSAFVNGDA